MASSTPYKMALAHPLRNSLSFVFFCRHQPPNDFEFTSRHIYLVHSAHIHNCDRNESRIVLSGARTCATEISKHLKSTDKIDKNPNNIVCNEISNRCICFCVQVHLYHADAKHSVICFLHATIDTCGGGGGVCVCVCFALDFISLNYALASKARIHKTSGSAVPLSTRLSLANQP